MFRLGYFNDLNMAKNVAIRLNWKNISMRPVVDTQRSVTLVGGGDVAGEDLARVLPLAPVLVAADGGANQLRALGHLPDHVIGDLDSIDPGVRAELGARVVHVADQDSTDLDKALRLIRAPLVIGLGFDGGRLDHTLAAMSSVVRHGRSRVVLLGAEDLCFLAPPQITLDLQADARFSLFPMGRVTGRSEGLHWPIAGLEFAPDSIIGTSNRVTAGRVDLGMDAPAMLVLLARCWLDDVLGRLLAAPDWPETPRNAAEDA